MACSNGKVRRLLSDYHSGQLDAEARLSVEHHLAGCATCRELLRLMDRLSEHGDSTNGEGTPHLSSYQLSTFYLNSETLDPDQKRRIESHLETCDLCAQEFRFLTELESDLAAIGESAPDQARNPERVRAWYALFQRPAFAYALVLLFAYPTWTWVRDQFSEPPAAPTQNASQESTTLRESLRSEGEAVIVHRRDSSAVVRLRIPFYHLTDENDYTFAVFTENGRKLPSVPTIPVYRDAGKIDLWIGTSGMKDGTYTLEVSEQSRASSAPLGRASYLFQIKTGP